MNYQRVPYEKGKFSVQDVQFRRALLSDFEAIMAFGDLYEGGDYLWALYEEFVSDPENYCIVAVLNDVVIGYGMSVIIDGGMTSVQRSGRISPEFKGNGIFIALQDELDKHIMRNKHKVLYETFSTKTKVDKVEPNNPFRPRYKAVFIRETRTVRFQQNMMPLDLKETSVSQTGVRKLGYADVKLLFETKEVSSELFPSRRLYHFMVGYRVLDANIHHLLCKRSGVYVTLTAKDESDLSSSSKKPCTGRGAYSVGCDFKAESNSAHLDLESVHRVCMMTNLFCFPTKSKGFCSFLDIYARPEAPHKHLSAHLQNMKREMQRRFPGRDGVINVLYGAPLNNEQLLSCFRDVGLGEMIPNGEKYGVLWERPKQLISNAMSKI